MSRFIRSDDQFFVDGDERTRYEPALRRPQRLRFHIKNAKLFSSRID